MATFDDEIENLNNKKKQEAQRACIAHLSFNEKHTSSLKSVTCKSQIES